MSNKSIICGLVFVLLMGFAGASDANAQQMSKILKTMEDHKNALQSLKASVKMTEYESALGDETSKTGSVSYVPRPGRDALVRIDWVKPDETLIVASGKYILYRKRLGQAIVGKTDGSKKQSGSSNGLKFMGMSKKELEENYEVKYLGDPTVAGVSTWHLKLIPKGADSFKEAELWVDGDGMPIQAMIVQKNKDKSTIRLSSIKKNEIIKTSIFSLDLKGVKIIDG